jgi:hypothetical protein
MTDINTLVEDIYKLFDPEETHTPSEDNLNEFAEKIKEVMRRGLSERENPNILRFSNLGKQDRQLWYMTHGYDQEEMLPKTYLKFLYGHLIEAMLIFLIKETDHVVEREQEEVEVDGIKGHIDCVVDGVVVDVKSASPYGYKKFEDASLFEKDPFGYVQQISGYANCVTPGVGPAFLAFDKVSADICLLPVSVTISEQFKPEERIAHVKQVIHMDEPPPRCFDDGPDGKSGNRKLGTECSYCNYKFHCWDNLRTFLYADKPRYLTRVERTPDVYEVKR